MSLRNHVQELDGVRGIAILLVLTTHFIPDGINLHAPALEWMKKVGEAGWVGVDLFFVLSGFLITGILMRTKGKSGALGVFFARRALRIFPLYLTALVAIFLVLPRILGSGGVALNPEFEKLLHFQGWVWMHCTNFGIYFSPLHTFRSPVVSVEHFWSLSVEEHFYLIWPLVIFGASRQRLKAVCLGILCFSLIIRLAGLACHQNTSFFALTPCRIDALAIGSFIAVYAADHPLQDLYRRASVVSGCTASALAAIFLVEHGLWQSSSWIEGPGLTLIGLFFGALLVIVLTCDAASLLRRFCRSSALRLFGKFSYGLYVIHGLMASPMDGLIDFASVTKWVGSAASAMLLVVVVKILISLAAAAVSWQILEHPMLQLKRLFEVEPDNPYLIKEASIGAISGS